jgi:hypothetical protein
MTGTLGEGVDYLFLRQPKKEMDIYVSKGVTENPASS